MHINHLLVSSQNPKDFEELRSKVKVTWVKTSSFLAHFRLDRTKSQNPFTANAMKVPIKQHLVSIKNHIDYFESRSKVNVTGVKI